ncbi:sigma-70 family RNA polymerase sigma factor [Thalassospiraceae bacterium LMO-JJ14]|nr:sigma-70 family RNA polymerase sigma factor [Thalassospiraceae bacterium LMO-JJ14]
MTDETDTAETADGATSLMHRVAASGDRQAFAVLFAHFAPRVKSYMLKLGTNDSLADELAQETLLMVWRKAGQFDRAKASPSTWIFTIARNLRIDAFRKISRPELDPNDPALVPDHEEPQDDRVVRLQQAQKVRDAMALLNEEQSEVVRLSFFEDMSHSAIAERLGLPLGTVKSRLRLAFSKIRDAVGESLK